MDITHTPAWREIFEQMKSRSQFVRGERILVFTPEGARALPSDLAMSWPVEEVKSQKHVMIACHWPSPDQAPHIQARHIYARQSCAKLEEAFWD